VNKKMLYIIIISFIAVILLTLAGLYINNQELDRSTERIDKNNYNRYELLSYLENNSNDILVREQIKYFNNTSVKYEYYKEEEYKRLNRIKNTGQKSHRIDIGNNIIYSKNNQNSQGNINYDNYLNRYQNILESINQYQIEKNNGYTITSTSFEDTNMIGFLGHSNTNSDKKVRIKLNNSGFLEELNYTSNINGDQIKYNISITKNPNYQKYPNWIEQYFSRNERYKVEFDNRIIKVENNQSSKAYIEEITLKENQDYKYSDNIVLDRGETVYLGIYNENLIKSKQVSDVIKSRVSNPKSIKIKDTTDRNYTYNNSN
jgi:hypothetical protein